MATTRRLVWRGELKKVSIVGDKYSEIESMIAAIHGKLCRLPHTGQRADYLRAVAMIRTKLDEAKLWTGAARPLETPEGQDYP